MGLKACSKTQNGQRTTFSIAPHFDAQYSGEVRGGLINQSTGALPARLWQKSLHAVTEITPPRVKASERPRAEQPVAFMQQKQVGAQSACPFGFCWTDLDVSYWRRVCRCCHTITAASYATLRALPQFLKPDSWVCAMNDAPKEPESFSHVAAVVADVILRDLRVDLKKAPDALGP